MDKFQSQTEYRPIIEYYDQTWMDYRILWLNGQNRSIHFGYFEEDTQSHAEALENMNRVLAARGQINPGDRVLDAGCGQGGSSFWIAENCQATTVGITPVLTQIVRARELARERQLEDQCQFVQASYLDTPFPDESFDVIWACESVCHAPDKADFYREAHRLLKPGGRVVLAEYVRSSRPLSEKGEALLHGWLDGWAIEDIDSREEHLGHMRALGYDDIQLDDITPHTRRSLGKLYWISAALFPIAVALKALKVRSEVQHGNVVGSIKQFQALKKGHWFYAIISAQKK